MRLGEMLVRDGRLTEVQLKQALSAQAKDGGRLGTVLFEMGLVDLEALTVYLGLELGIPIATGAMLERSKSPARKLLSPQQAFKFKCVPIVVQDRQLIAAVEDPHDFAMLEALASQTGYRVLPRVAPEVRIYYYIEQYYRVVRPARFVKFGDSPRGDAATSDPALPSPPLPGLPPVPVSVVSPPGPRPRLRSVKIPKLFDESESLELDAEDLIETLDAEEAIPLTDVIGPRLSRTTTPPPMAPVQVDRPITAMRGADAIAALRTVTDRDKMIDVLLGYAAGAFQAAVLFAVREQMAFGWKAVGELPGRAFVEHVLLPLEAPSIVQAAVAADGGVFHGPVSPSTVNTYLYKVLGCAEPATATSCAISIGKRVVNVLYGHGAELSPSSLAELRELCASAAEAYARLIAVRKKK
ncbi:MAG TPA: hypothetical protein VGG74_13780 [Kofleriaceae bacterium]|jgi:hypothetical protein